MAAIAVTLGTQGGNSQEKNLKKAAPSSGDDDLTTSQKKTFPEVDFLSPALSARELKQAEKYDKGLPVLSQDADVSTDLEAVIAFHWEREFEPIPVAKSDVVIIGEVVNAKALLSANKTSVFSNFEIKVLKILKNNKEAAATKDESLFVEREGGIVRYPSGHKFWSRVVGQRMPVTGAKYLFFLTNNFPIQGVSEDLYILTAYEIKNGRVSLLDDLKNQSAGVQAYKDKDESVFLNDVVQAIGRE